LEKASDYSLSNTKSNTKVYIEIVEYLRSMIEKNRLSPGDKIPSERELSDRLDVGRSSVREALRALELLGLIETRRGEGTFLKDFREHQLVKLLSTFVLQDDRAKKDVKETKYLLEIGSIKLIFMKENLEALNVQKWEEHQLVDDDEFFYDIIKAADNFLLQKIWLILKEYYHSLEENLLTIPKISYINLLKAIENHDENLAIDIYKKEIRNLS